MDRITSEIVETTWKKMAAMSRWEAQKLAKLFVKQQPVIATYLLAVDSDLLNQGERQLLFYLGTVIWQIMSHRKTPLPVVTEEALYRAEDTNIKMAEYLQGETESGFVEATETIISSYRQPEVLQYVVEALMEEPEEGCIIRDDNLGIMFLDLKTVIDCFDV
jgi:hypothetical protein